MTPAWLDRAACAGAYADAWFPDASASATHELRYAKTVCGRCDVQAECLEDALERKDGYGLRGGLTPKQRQRLMRERREAS